MGGAELATSANPGIGSHFAADGIGAFRNEFPGAQKWRYFDVAARGLLPIGARRAADLDLDERLYNGGDKAAMFRSLETARSRFGRLIGAQADEIAITKNISEGINIVAAGFPWSEGDNVVVCADLEHPNNVYPWLHLARTRGVRMKSVKGRDGRIPADEVIGAIDSRTRIVAAATVSFVPGLRTDLDEIGKECRRRGVLFLVDGAQSIGILDLDVDRTPVDAVACSTQKGLLGLYGMGLLYCRREWAERLTPVYLARFGVDLGDAHEADIGSLDFRFMQGARRFDLGNYNYTAAAVLNASLDVIDRAGTKLIEQHVARLSQRLAEGLHEIGLAVAGYPFQGDIANMVTVTGSGEAVASLGDYLQARQVKFSIRKGAIRFSSHLYNSVGDVEEVLELSKRWKNGSR